MKKFFYDFNSDLLSPITQDDSLATYTSKISTENSRIDFKKSATETIGRIRGLSPIPGAWALFKGKKIKILKVKSCAEQAINYTNISGAEIKAGTVNIIDKRFFIKCGSEYIEVLEAQFEGKRKMPAFDLINGLQPQAEPYILE